VDDGGGVKILKNLRGGTIFKINLSLSVHISRKFVIITTHIGKNMTNITFTTELIVTYSISHLGFGLGTSTFLLKNRSLFF
jgi:hypothetical protein